MMTGPLYRFTSGDPRVAAEENGKGKRDVGMIYLFLRKNESESYTFDNVTAAPQELKEV